MTIIAFVGLGAMGLPMAKNLVKAGHEVRGFDLNSAALAELNKAGGKAAASAKQAATGAQVLMLMVVNAAQAEQVMFADGALDALNPGSIVVLMATCPQAAVQKLAQQVLEHGHRLVDAPVSGGVVGAQSGTLTMMVACETVTYESVSPLLQVLGERVFHVGQAPGQGAMVKTINQLLCGVHIAVAAEAFALADKAGLDLELLLQIMSGSAASSWMLQNRGPRMLEDDPEVKSAVDIFVKDLSIVLQTGHDMRAGLPIAAAAHQMYLAASGRGDGKADDSQVIQTYRVMNGVKG
ncbi:MAG: NAD(P)-dependent oxidoreductase [Burkholderiaceae bacterium]|nr:NAD(P)-dependent oxidoreductase [Burkholderiaceae bacterium]MCD8516151.1 NAD(P)-dependent oxidoreductase [Burkholderiaceae bacterium]MCD8566158.1 NAD(P)-dependent oxidoreductase [Burkholderiaceae bacterium]